MLECEPPATLPSVGLYFEQVLRRHVRLDGRSTKANASVEGRFRRGWDTFFGHRRKQEELWNKCRPVVAQRQESTTVAFYADARAQYVSVCSPASCFKPSYTSKRCATVVAKVRLAHTEQASALAHAVSNMHQSKIGAAGRATDPCQCAAQLVWLA